MIKNAILLVALCPFYLTLWGCAAPLAVQEIGSISPVAFSHIGDGGGDSSWLAHYEDVVEATKRAGKALSLKLDKKKPGKDKIFFHYVDDKGNQLNVLIERRTTTMTNARFDVGLFGTRSMGHLMIQQIIFELKQADAFLRDWQPAEKNQNSN
jgi:hypothetical protein